MGIIRQGILGGFRNKTGSVVGAYWRKLDVIRGLPRKSAKPPTEAQLNQQFKFGLVTGFLSWLRDLIDVGFKSVTSSSASPMNYAVAYHLKNAIIGVAPNFTIDYPKILFSKGKLELPADADVTSEPGSELVFNWDTGGLDDKYIDATDKLSILIYNPVLDRFVKLTNAALRSAGTFTLNVPPTFATHQVYCYISFNSAKTKSLVSNSFYLGRVMVIA
nr:DUF6266 family protein [Pedobacter panaciterrae]